MKITERSIDLRNGSEGPREDPYSFSELTMNVNGSSCTLHMGLACWIEVDGKVVLDQEVPEELIAATWEEMVGIDPCRFEKIYHERFYFDDPMGSPSMYE